ncbi:threonylcarbamoyl-AMP synthase [Butyricicoccus sp. 1XD8-22]|nr:threonylcarbamoyl-AMP synthase [Butyricicoccus sp. 1XD8-22]
METILLNPTSDPYAVDRAAGLLRAGEVVGMPTETVYGLAANALDPAAVGKIFAAKGRPQDNPLIVHIADAEALERICHDVPEGAKRLAAAFWPGPLTMVLPRAPHIPDVVTAGLPTVGVRLPAHPVARDLIRHAGVPVAAPSANLSGRPSTTTSAHVLADLGGRIPAVLEGGPCEVGVESTIVSFAGALPRLLRPGGVSLEQLREVLGEVEIDRALREQLGDDVQVSAPGMKYRHYAPKAPVIVVCGAPEDTAAYISKHLTNETGVLCFTEFAYLFEMHEMRTMGTAADPLTQARRIFDALRQFDETDVHEIYTQCPADEGIGLAVANRLKKAAGFKVVNVV